MQPANARVCVLGAGSYGTALAAHLARVERSAILWGRDPALIRQLEQTHHNSRYLADIALPGNLGFSAEPDICLRDATDVLIAVPSSGFRDALAMIHRHCSGTPPAVIWACKGLDAQSGGFLSDVFRQTFGDQAVHAVISGPTFARELAVGLPTAITVAANRSGYARYVSELLHSVRFRAYASDDLNGVQLGGALKNIYAIAAGISDGLEFGANARVALITRGLAEMRRLGDSLGARSDTLYGLSGNGDLVLTCTDNQSRNRRFGLALAGGLNTAEAIESIGQAVEGVGATSAAIKLAHRQQVEMPIVEQVFEVLHNGRPALQAVETLLARAPRAEAGD